ncbi:MAG: GNAT family N-acetyltransferase [Devosiaceae bacterium]|nr:GNAT family N-acetyltransferase [Devosiaceae bacterium]
MSSQNQEKTSNPFLSHAFFLSLEQSGSATKETGWLPQHILLEQDEKPVALMPLFLKSHSMGEYVFDHAWADALERAGAPYYPKLQSSIPFTPVSAPKLLVPDGNETYKSALLETAQQLASHHGASSVHATFVGEKEEKLAKTNGWLVRNDIQFHWKNKNYASFEDFLGTLTSRKRKLIRSERKKSRADGIKISWLKGAEIKEHHWDSFFEFYQDTGARKWGQPYLNRSFFSYLSQNMPQNLLLMLASEGDNFIAGALNFIGHDKLFGRYWGCTKHVPFLHFELCYYQAMDYAIATGIKTVEAGAQGEHKLARGYVPTTTRSIHWLQNPDLHLAVKDYLDHEMQIISQNHQILDKSTPFKSKPNQNDKQGKS